MHILLLLSFCPGFPLWQTMFPMLGSTEQSPEAPPGAPFGLVGHGLVGASQGWAQLCPGPGLTLAGLLGQVRRPGSFFTESQNHRITEW